MVNLKAIVQVGSSVFTFSGRRAVELKYWTESPSKPIAFTRGPGGDDFMYSPMGSEPFQLNIRFEEVLQRVS